MVGQTRLRCCLCLHAGTTPREQSTHFITQITNAYTHMPTRGLILLILSTPSNPGVHTQLHSFMDSDTPLFTHTHTHAHANRLLHSPDTSADRLWGQLLSYCVTLALAQGPAQFNTMTSPCGHTLPLR